MFWSHRAPSVECWGSSVQEQRRGVSATSPLQQPSTSAQLTAHHQLIIAPAAHHFSELTDSGSPKLQNQLISRPIGERPPIFPPIRRALRWTRTKIINLGPGEKREVVFCVWFYHLIWGQWISFENDSNKMSWKCFQGKANDFILTVLCSWRIKFQRDEEVCNFSTINKTATGSLMRIIKKFKVFGECFGA